MSDMGLDGPIECWHEKARVTGKTIGTLRLHCPTCGLAVGVNPKWVFPRASKV